MYQNNRRYTAAEYLAEENDSAIKREYVDGEVYPMPDASRRHNLLVGNLFGHAWRAAAARQGCRVFGSDMKICVEACNCFYYSDVSGSCAPDDRNEFYLSEPCFIVEVLSAETAAADRREKRMNYAMLRSLCEYAIIDQNRMRVDVYSGAGSLRSLRMLTQPDGVLQLSCLNLRLTLQELYDGIELPAPGAAESQMPECAIPVQF